MFIGGCFYEEPCSNGTKSFTSVHSDITIMKNTMTYTTSKTMYLSNNLYLYISHVFRCSQMNIKAFYYFPFLHEQNIVVIVTRKKPLNQNYALYQCHL